MALFGLIVAKADDRGKGQFTRIGAFSLIFNIRNHGELKDLLSNVPNTFMGESLYKEILGGDENGMNQYVITLV